MRRRRRSRQRSAIAAHLAEPVELVAGEVAEHEQLRVEGVDHLRQPALVDLDHGDVGVGLAGASAAAMPAGMFAPVWFVATAVPFARSASASRRVVVVLPFVAETSATRRRVHHVGEQVGLDAEHDAAH